MWQTIRSSIFNRHGHDHSYAAIVLAGGYEEAGDHGRFAVAPGHVVLHERFETHINRFSASGAVVLNIRLQGNHSFLPGLAAIKDADSIVRLAEKCHTQAARSLLASITPLEPHCEDWPDELASDLIVNPCLRLSDWSERKGLRPWTVSRGFMGVFGVTPAVFRARTRARKAWKAILQREDALATIAADFGFADQSHMTRNVRQITGMPPQMWRKLQIGSRPPCA